MFTGIVQESAEVLSVKGSEVGASFEIKAGKLLTDLKLGDSVCIDGVCLTVSEKKKQSFVVEVTPETLRCTNLGQRRAGDIVNLEPSARLTDFLGGHWVQGHVDQAGEVLSIAAEGNSKIFAIRATGDVLRYCTLKGSVTVNGVSLTISGLKSEYFEVTIIPHTLEATNFATLATGDRVNLEVDIMSKYVESHVSHYVESYLRRLGKLSLVLMLASGSLLASSFSLGPNSVLVYENHTSEGESQFVLRIARYRPDIVLEWESKSHQGTLQLYRQALSKGEGFAFSNLFEVGVDRESPDVMTVWLSGKMYQELLNNGKTKIKMNRLSNEMRLKGEGTHRLMIDKEVREIPVIFVEDKRKTSWTFHNNPDNPILVEYVRYRFRQRLKAVSTAPTNKLRWIRKLPPVR